MNENLEYPEETFGTKAAREIRAVCNNLNLTDEEREIYFNKALDLIYKDCPTQDPRKKI